MNALSIMPVVLINKAFNKVDHQRLLLKLHCIGLNGKIINWISAFLSNRTQRVVLEKD